MSAIEPTATNSKKFHEAAPSITTIGLAPAGGCVVEVRRMAAIAVPTDKATESGVKPKIWKNKSPTKAVMR